MDTKIRFWQFWKMMGTGTVQGVILFVILSYFVRKFESLPQLPVIPIGKVLITLILTIVWAIGISFGLSVISLNNKFEIHSDHKNRSAMMGLIQERLMVSWGCFETGLIILPFLLLFEKRIAVFIIGACIFIASFFFMAPWRFKVFQGDKK